MKPTRSIPSATVIPVLVYPDVREAVGWLSTAFGFGHALKSRISTRRPRGMSV